MIKKKHKKIKCHCMKLKNTYIKFDTIKILRTNFIKKNIKKINGQGMKF